MKTKRLKCEACGLNAPPGTEHKDGDVLLCPMCSDGLRLIVMLDNLLRDGKCGMCDDCIAFAKVNSTGSTATS